jgi:hypothetical protein
LSGDQVYLNIGFDSPSLRPSEIRERIADDYAEHWQALGSILSRGATWMVPDDHEYWNDYPNYKTNIPTLQALRLNKVRKAWTNAARDGGDNIQRALPVETFKIGNDIRFCLADLRSHRHESDYFLADVHMQQVLNWATTLTCPGVLLASQPLIVDENKDEKNLRSYEAQYATLIQALAATPYDIVYLSGDAHFGRVAEVKLGTNGGRLIEVVSSPLSNLTFLNGVATATPKRTPKHFPPRGVHVPGIDPQPVRYRRKVSTVSKWFDAYPKRRAHEHFMTIGLQQDPGGVKLTVQAWRVRDQNSSRVPRKKFNTAFATRLA